MVDGDRVEWLRTIADADRDGMPDFDSAPENTFNYEYTEPGNGGVYSSQAAIYRWERKSEVVFTVAFRGSEAIALGPTTGLTDTLQRSAQQKMLSKLMRNFRRRQNFSAAKLTTKFSRIFCSMVCGTATKLS